MNVAVALIQRAREAGCELLRDRAPWWAEFSISGAAGRLASAAERPIIFVSSVAQGRVGLVDKLGPMFGVRAFPGPSIGMIFLHQSPIGRFDDLGFRLFR